MSKVTLRPAPFYESLRVADLRLSLAGGSAPNVDFIGVWSILLCAEYLFKLHSFWLYCILTSIEMFHQRKKRYEE